MAALSAERIGQLLASAQQASARAYAPFSNFCVGAAILTQSGEIFTGCNVENSSYGLSNCAERTAIFSAVAAGAVLRRTLSGCGCGGASAGRGVLALRRLPSGHLRVRPRGRSDLSRPERGDGAEDRTRAVAGRLPAALSVETQRGIFEAFLGSMILD